MNTADRADRQQFQVACRPGSGFGFTWAPVSSLLPRSVVGDAMVNSNLAYRRDEWGLFDSTVPDGPQQPSFVNL
jgi:hypothetical protein